MADDFKDVELYDGKTFASLTQDIVNNTSRKRAQIEQIIQDLRKLIKDLGAAAQMAPLIRDYIDSSIKNDDQLVKLANVIQRLISNNINPDGSGGSELISDEERKALLDAVRDEIDELHEESTTNVDIPKE